MRFVPNYKSPNTNAPVTNVELTGNRSRIVKRASESNMADKVNSLSSEPRQLDVQNKKYNGATTDASGAFFGAK